MAVNACVDSCHGLITLRLLPSFSRSLKPAQPSLQNKLIAPLTRKEFYDLAARCHEYALELARHDQSRVSLKHCYEFNEWLPRIKSYDLLTASLSGLTPARPIARWQIMVLGAVVGMMIAFALPARLDRTFTSAIFYGYLFSLFIFYFVPERCYGTTIELLEAKLLRIVEAMGKALDSGKLEFTEAAYFRAKEHLQAARHELRQQIDLAHRRWR
jgi:hypothetical protein